MVPKTPESPRQPGNQISQSWRGNQSRILIETDEAEAPVLVSLRQSTHFEKSSCWERFRAETRASENEMFGWDCTTGVIHNWGKLWERWTGTGGLAWGYKSMGL